MSDDWNIVEVVSTMDSLIFAAERNGLIAGAAEVHPPWTNLDDPRPATLEMIYVVRECRCTKGPATLLVNHLKELFPGLSHTSVLSLAGRRFAERHGIPPLPQSPHRRRRGSGQRETAAADEVLSEEKAEEVGQALLARARSGQRLPPRSTKAGRI
ncbi:GNAT family N-acetyltransferase [Kribbella sp. ALI-6-A]|uniref:GNAT family N-acetyltransferase n=1 Tax=Kribbella sp. ALI-6-A TaxID=1933817 RepID=UPI00117AEEF6|nr:GNAT family N-acetyltransferase [Kribbella sp. ALI-6-A]